MEFFDVVKTRRSIRNFKPEPLPEGTVEQILEAARFAMSGANGQPWEFVVVTNKETKDKIAEINLECGMKRIFSIEQTREMQYRHNMFHYDRSKYRTDEDIVEFLGRLRKKTEAAYDKSVLE